MGKPLHLVYAYLVGRKYSSIKIDKITTRRKHIPVTVDLPEWRTYITTGGAA